MSSLQTSKLLGGIHHFLGRMPLVVRIAVKLRNQFNAIVAAHFSQLSVSTVSEENGEYWLIKSCAPTAVNFIDAGANVGDWSAHFITAMRACPVGLLFEANSVIAEETRRRFIEHRGVQVIHAALSDYSGVAMFFEGTTSARMSSLTQDNAGKSSRGREVRVTQIDKEVEKLGWDRISFLKIDTEGHDYFVLRGARNLIANQKIDVIQFECNYTWARAGATLTGAVAFLKSHGYSTYQLRPNGLYSVDFEFFGDSLGYANWISLTESTMKRLHELIRE